jgi:hypothetical protein
VYQYAFELQLCKIGLISVVDQDPGPHGSGTFCPELEVSDPDPSPKLDGKCIKKTSKNEIIS